MSTEQNSTDAEFIASMTARCVAAKLAGETAMTASWEERNRLYDMLGEKNVRANQRANPHEYGVALIAKRLSQLRAQRK